MKKNILLITICILFNAKTIAETADQNAPESTESKEEPKKKRRIRDRIENDKSSAYLGLELTAGYSFMSKYSGKLQQEIINTEIKENESDFSKIGKNSYSISQSHDLWITSAFGIVLGGELNKHKLKNLRDNDESDIYINKVYNFLFNFGFMVGLMERDLSIKLTYGPSMIAYNTENIDELNYKQTLYKEAGNSIKFSVKYNFFNLIKSNTNHKTQLYVEAFTRYNKSQIGFNFKEKKDSNLNFYGNSFKGYNYGVVIGFSQMIRLDKFF